MASCSRSSSSNSAKMICPICYEDLKPTLENLQFISVCGHVFHELCLEQWFEYCPGMRRCCPVCKQMCTDRNVGPLYFQSEEGVDDKVRSLEEEISIINEIMDNQDKEMKTLHEELRLCKEQARKEAALNNEAQRQKAYFRQLLHRKSMDLEKTILKCSKLQEKYRALSEELVALKLSYEELTSKCNLLEEGQAHSSRSLEKAKGKISKLKTRVQELEVAAESKNTEVLRVLEISEKTNHFFQDSVSSESVSLPVHNPSMQNQRERAAYSRFSLVPLGSLIYKACRSTQREKLDPIGSLTCQAFRHRQMEKLDSHCQVSEKDNAPENFAFAHGHFNVELDKPKDQDLEQTDNKRRQSVVASNDLAQQSSLLACSTIDNENISSVILDDKVTMLDHDSPQAEPPLNIRKEHSYSTVLSRHGGLLGPDVTNRHLGKWGKRGQQLISCLADSQVSEKDNAPELSVFVHAPSVVEPYKPKDEYLEQLRTDSVKDSNEVAPQLARQSISSVGSSTIRGAVSSVDEHNRITLDDSTQVEAVLNIQKEISLSSLFCRPGT